MRLRRRAALASAAALAAAPRALAAPPREDARHLLAPAVYEQLMWAVCEIALRSGALRGEDERLLRRLRDGADGHARALEAAMRERGAAVPARPTRADRVPLPGFTQARRGDQFVDYAVATAHGRVGAWYAALQSLADPDLRRLGGAALAADAQALLALRDGRLGPAFETGRRE